MRIVTRAEFLAMPAGTVFAKYEPCVFELMQIKGKSLIFDDGGGDYCYQDIIDAIDSTGSGDSMDKLEMAEKEGVSLAMNFHCQGRDGCYDKDQLFAVLEHADVEALIERLKQALSEARSGDE